MAAEFLVEHPDDDPDGRVPFSRGEGRIQVDEIVTTGQDDRPGLLDPGLRQSPRQSRITDDEADAHRRQGLGGVVVGADGDDHLVAQPKLVDRPQSEMLQPADDDVTGR